MAKILEVRRVFRRKTYQEFELRYVKNPSYDLRVAMDYRDYGLPYTIPEYFEKEVLVNKSRKVSHIEYRIQCEYCHSSRGWVRRKDARYCSAGCRKMAYREREKRQ